ncbi:MAG TPA: LysR family transcriptional regulator [Alphaproteobacteria bacterium]|nr:LysR family transcriptional regulator [Alphaproteobacteria bacterium]
MEPAIPSLKQLRSFVSVAETLNFRRAAVGLGMTQPTLSHHIQSLEAEIGVTLFERFRRGVRLTIAGRNFLHGARHLLLDYDHLIREAGRAGRAEIGTLSVGIFTSFASGPVHDLLSTYRARFPDVAISIVEGNRSDHTTSLHEHQIDVAIVPGQIDSPPIDCFPLLEQRLFLAVPSTHRLAQAPALTWTSIRKERFITQAWQTNAEFYHSIVGRLTVNGEVPRIERYDVGRDGLLNLVGAGFGVTIAMESASAVDYPRVTFRPIEDEGAMIPLTVAWFRDNPNPVLRRFLSLARQHRSDPPLN